MDTEHNEVDTGRFGYLRAGMNKWFDSERRSTFCSPKTQFDHMPGVSQNTLGNPGSLERLAERFKLLLTRMRIGAQMLMIENLYFWIHFLASAPISWQSKKQPTVAWSSMEAKYTAATRQDTESGGDVQSYLFVMPIFSYRLVYWAVPLILV